MGKLHITVIIYITNEKGAEKLLFFICGTCSVHFLGSGGAKVRDSKSQDDGKHFASYFHASAVPI